MTATVTPITATDPWLPDDHPTHVLLTAAAAWDHARGDSTFSDWLRARAYGCTCGDPQTCKACGTQLCPTCQVGEPSRCEHGNGPFCVGCDVDACAGCAHDLSPAPFMPAEWSDR